MILGGSNCQINAYKRAKLRGIETICIDYTDGPAAKEICTIHEKVSTYEYEQCLVAAQKHGVDGVMTLGTDQPVLTCAKVAIALNLPTLINVKTAENVTNKRFMKNTFDKHNIPNSKHCFIKKGFKREELAQLKAPFVLKPVDSQGQRGIFKLQNLSEIERYMDETLSFSREDIALVEEYYNSDEITISAWVENGVAHLLSITDRIIFEDDLHIGICSSHHFPSKYLTQHYHEIKEVLDKTVEAFEILNGPFYMQALVGKKGVLVNEIATRIGGAFEDVFIPYVSNFDILDATINAALGEKVLFNGWNFYDKNIANHAATSFVSVQLFFTTGGVIGEMTDINVIKALPYIVDCGFNYGKGSEILKAQNATARLGHAVIFAQDLCSLNEYIKAFYENLVVKNLDGENMLRRNS